MKNIDKCLKCGAEMQEGFLIEHRIPTRWMAGKPDISLLGFFKTRGREQRQVASYRCAECGYLEMYARAAIS